MLNNQLRMSVIGAALLFFCLQLVGSSLTPIRASEGTGTLSEAAAQATPLVFSPDGNALAGASGGGSITVLDLISGEEQVIPGDPHAGPITALAFSPDAGTLASVNETTITLWDVRSARERAFFPGEFGGLVTGVAFGPDGMRLAGVYDEARILVWDLESGVRQWTLQPSGDGVREIAFSPDGAFLASSGNAAQITLWDLASGDARATFTSHSGAAVTGLAFSPEGTLLASADQDANITLWDPQRNETETLAGHRDSIKGFVFSPDGSTLASDGMDAEIKVWDLLSGREHSALPGFFDDVYGNLAFSRDGAMLASVGEHNEILLWDVASGALRQVLAGHSDFIVALAFSATQPTLASASEDGQVIVWDLAAGLQRLALQMPLFDSVGFATAGSGFPATAQEGDGTASPASLTDSQTDLGQADGSGPSTVDAGTAGFAPRAAAVNKSRKRDWKGITGLSVSPDGKLIGSTGADGLVRIWSDGLGEAAALAGHLGSPATDVVFSPNGARLISVGRDTVVRSWDLTTGQQARALLAHEHPIRAVAVSPNGNFLATAGEETRIMLWDAKKGTLQAILAGHLDFVNGLAFSNNGGYLASAGADDRVLLWDVQTGKLLHTLRGHSDDVNTIAFSQNNQTLISGSDDGTIKVWDVVTGTQVRSLSAHQAPVRSVAISPNEKTLVSGGEDRSIIVWDLAVGRPLRALTGNMGSVNTLVFKPSGRLLAGDEDNQITEWDLGNGGRVRTAKPTRQLPFGSFPAAAAVAAASAPSVPSVSYPMPLAWASSEPVATGFFPRILGQLLDWLIPPASAGTLPDPDSGPGGPILVINAPGSGFGSYYAEILRNEGLNAFSVVDIGNVTAAMLSGYDLVILAKMPLSANQVTMLSDWVGAGGNLIAMRPDAQLAGLLGLTPVGATLSDGYLLVDTAVPPGNGIVGETIQFHGTADRYTLNGASSVATLFSDATTATSNPALSISAVGPAGGQAAAFTYDLATSIVYTRQGNPAWAAQERDGFLPIRSDDKYYGDALGDPQPDWIDFSKVAIPQADEQQRLLANLIIWMNLDKRPLPRFWYFPRGEKAVVIMTGDDHANGGTIGRFEQFLAASPAGCSVADWECVRGTSYLFNGTPLTDAQAAAYTAAGFEVGLHVNTNCQDYTFATLESFYTQQIGTFSAAYPSIPAPATQRHHCIAWSDWVTGAKVQLNHGVRLDTSYYFWPASWVLNRPGFFTGSGMPMRFSDLDGTLIDVYQAASQMTDESGQQYPFTIDALLDRALGEEGFYGAFTINAHTDVAQIHESDAVVSAALARSVPVVTSLQMLEWMDGRNDSWFGAIGWDGGVLSFSVTPGAGANGLQALVPMITSSGVISSVTRDGSPVGFASEAIKGIEYARIEAVAGTYVVTYSGDTTPPAVVSVSPSDGATEVSQATQISAVFDEGMEPSTIDATSFQLWDAGNAPVTATVTYDASTRTATLTPATSLAGSSSYVATISGGLTGPTDLSGNALPADVVWSFTTAALPGCPCSMWGVPDVPTKPSSGDPGSIEVGVKFMSQLDGFINGIRFYKGLANTGTHVGNLWTADGTLLATATFANESASGWQEVAFDVPVPITAGVVYVASYFAPNGNYALDESFFGLSGADNFPLLMSADGVQGGNGVYRYGNGGFPTQTYRASNYWVDVVFDTAFSPDSTPPTVISNAPANGEADVTLAAKVTATFSEAMDPATVNGSTFQLFDSVSAPVAATVSYDPATRTATLTPAVALAASSPYTARINGGAQGPTDLVGNALDAAVTWSFVTGAPSQCPCSGWSDTDVPGNPAEGDSGAVELGVKFKSDLDGFVTGLRFYKGLANTGTHVGNLWALDGTLLATAVFTNETGSGWQQVDFSAPVAITANTVYVASYHAPNGHYASDPLFFSGAGVDRPPLHFFQDGVVGGNGVYAYGPSGFPSFSWNASNYWVDVVFTTTDSVAPTVVGTSPSDGASNVDFAEAITAVFSEPMDPATVSSSTFGLSNSVGQSVPASVSYDSVTRTATLSPTDPMAPSATYSATIQGGSAGVADLAANPMAGEVTWSFTTAAESVCCTIWRDSDAPGNPSEADSSAVELGVKFRADLDGFISGIRFFKGSGNTGTHIGNLWASDGTLLGSAVFAGETASGWQQVDFPSPVAISAGTVYVASYHAPNGHYAADAFYFTNSGADNPPLHLLQDGVSGGNGVYAYSATSTFPASSYAASNYWVDVVFRTDNGAAPTVIATSPVDGAVSVEPDTTVTATFSEAMEGASISASSFELRDAEGVLVPASVTYQPATRTAALTPAAALSSSAIYTATMKGGPSGATDVGGAPMGADFSWSFATAAPPSGYSVWSASDTPTVPAQADPGPVELGVKFSADLDGFISGIRFYKGITNTGTHLGNLWASDGTLLASATFTNETSTGWQQVDFSTPVAVSANTVYVASYHAPNGNYAIDQSYFSAAGVDRPPLHLLQNGVSGGNGVYGYGAGSAFPSNSYLASNYWVDVVFSTDNGAPPTVSATSPSDGSAEVAAGAVVAATFSEWIDPVTITASTFELRDGLGAPVPASVSYDAATRTATLTPGSQLAWNTTYTAVVRGGATDPRIKDLAGEALAADVSWSFTTAAASPCDLPANGVVAENCLPGSPSSEWDVVGAGDPTIQGFATDISINRGETVSFKVDTAATDYRLDIYRLGYYGGQGARKVATVLPSVSLPQVQPACLEDAATGLIDCGNWGVSASWSVPADATSGIYFAKAVRTDTGGASHIVFIVRDDASTSDLLFQTSDTTWQAYNRYGGNSLYLGTGPGSDGRAYAVSYNRPFNTREVDGGQDWLFGAEYPMVRWLESNGYDVTYFTGVDSDRRGALILNHKVFLSVGHDEYWSEGQRANVEAARDAGVSLAFLSGNEVFWKTRWENSIDGSGATFRTLVCYKETHANDIIDPQHPTWTGTWRDPRFSPPADGGRPENALTGTIFAVNQGATTSIRVPAEDGQLRFWRNTSVADLAPGSVATLPNGTLGYEWDQDLDNGFRPAGLVRLSTTTVQNAPVLVDYGSTYGSGEATHHLTLYRHSSGALVFGAGTVQWSWGLDSNHDIAGEPADDRMQQAMVNLFADMLVQPGSLQSNLVPATASTDLLPPTSSVVVPTAGSTLTLGAPVTISGSASDVGGGVVGAVEVSVDGGATWHPADGRGSWSYTWTPSELGPITIRSRAADDSGMIESAGAGVNVSVVSGP